MWIWPVFVIAAMAVAGQFYGVVGVILSGVSFTAMLVLYAGARNEVMPRRWLIPIYSVVCLLLVGSFIAGQLGVLSNRPVGAASSTVARAVSNAEQLRNTPSPGATLAGVDLKDQNLRGARLQGANATGASFERAVLEDAKLAGADLSGANLQGARLSGADLRGVNFTGADLRNAVLTNTCLRGANLTGAATKDLDATGAAVEDTVAPALQIGAAKVWPTSTPVVPTACPS